METYVPLEMMMEGWTPAHPQMVTYWSECDVFTWLQFGQSIEQVIEMYEGWLKKKTASSFREKVKAHWLASQFGKCHHKVNTWLKRCSVCDEQHMQCIQYLRKLKRRVVRYYETQDEVGRKWGKEFRDQETIDDSVRYYQILGLPVGVSRVTLDGVIGS